MKASDVMIESLKGFEGCRLTAYRDSAGVWTIGYGHTRIAKKGLHITQRKADDLLREDLAGFEKYVNGLGVCRTQGQFDALVDFAFNLGTGSLGGSTLLEKIRRGADTAEIQAEFRRWVYAGGKKLDGLVRRIYWEARRWAE